MGYQIKVKTILLLLLTCVLINQADGQASLLQRTISISIGQMALKDVIEQIEKENGISFAYSNLLDLSTEVTGNFSDEPLERVLDKLLKNNNLNYKLINKQITIFKVENGKDEFQLDGVVKDARTGEKLIGVAIFDQTSKTGTATNEKGYYSLNLSDGSHRIEFSYIGYKSLEKDIKIKKSTTVNVKLSPVSKELGEVTIEAEAEDHNITSTEVSVERMTMEQIEVIPVIMGETDIFKTLQLLPGISAISEGQSGFIVRGSGFDQNLILMDGMPIYYSSHMQGLYSVFNSDAVDAMTIYKGGTPARFGGRGASVLDVRMRESNFTEFGASLSVGLITSKFSLEAPLLKNKLSVFLSGRSTQMGVGYQYDQMTTEEPTDTKTSGKGNTDYTFFGPYEKWYDLNGKVIYKMNKNNRLFLSAYFGQDYALTTGLTDWGNRASSLRWNHLFNDKLSSNTSLIYSEYYTHNVNGPYVFRSGIGTYGVKEEFSYLPNSNNSIKFGFQSEYQDFNHGALEDQSQDDAGKFMPPMQGLESALFFENDQKLNLRLSTHYGLRFSMYHQLGPGDVHQYDEVSNESYSSEPFEGYTDVMSAYYNLEPRLSFNYLLNDKSSLKASYNRNAQYLRLMTLGGQIQWYDIWMPTTNNIKPMLTDQVALGYFRNFKDNMFKVSAETYYKWIGNAADFEDGLHNYLVDNLEAYVAMGKGKAYGFELSVEKTKGKINGRVSYNWSKSLYQIDVINKGRWYPNIFDRTHNLTAFGSYEFLKNLTLSATFIYNTGAPITLAESYYHIGGVAFPYWEARNKYRLPDYHRLDLGLTYNPDFLAIKLKKSNREIRTTIEGSVFNVYNRRNIRSINMVENRVGKDGIDPETPRFNQVGISTFGFMPSFQLKIQF